MKGTALAAQAGVSCGDGVNEVKKGAEQRIDIWLCYARFAKTRTLAQALVRRGKVRINRERISKASQMVRADDVITLSLGPKIRIIRVVGCGTRRGPANEAALLFEELTPTPDQTKPSGSDTASGSKSPLAPEPSEIMREPGAGRPTKRERRLIDRVRDRFRDL